MPDGILPPSDTTAPELAAETAEGAMIQRVRRNLVLWSGGTTLLILVALSIALYVAAATSLQDAGIAQLDAAMAQVRGERPNPDDQTRYGYIFGGRGSGTYAMVIDPAGDLVFPPSGPGPGGRVPPGLPYEAGIAAAASASTGRDVQTTELANTPVRILTETADVPGRGTYTLQVVQDRTTEQQTLEVIQFVLIVGGVLVLIVSFGFGAVYARRALVPIRESLANQRSALRRQREFAADASHELRTPLTVIRSSVDHLQRHRDEPVATVGDALEDIDDEVTHMTAIVEDLLLLARSDSGAIALERIPVDLGDVAADGALALGKPATDRGIRVEVDPQPAVVAGDPARLRQLVMILVDNAIRHSPTDGRVGVATRAIGNGAALMVEDDGPGIRPEDLPHLFERFYRAPGAPGGGTGLGLAIAAWIVDRHGGRIEVTNRAEGGARFIVRLPASGAVTA
jgi:signal transduction histidine kinase